MFITSVKRVKKKCKEQHPTVDVDKHRTSQVCPECDSRLLTVRVKGENGDVRECRGIKYCESDDCKSEPIKVRDALACQNIFRKGEQNYPDILNRAQKGDEHYWDPKQKRSCYDIDGKKMASKINAANPKSIDKSERNRRRRRRYRKNRRERIERLAQELEQDLSNMNV